MPPHTRAPRPNANRNPRHKQNDRHQRRAPEFTFITCLGKPRASGVLGTHGWWSPCLPASPQTSPKEQLNKPGNGWRVRGSGPRMQASQLSGLIHVIGGCHSSGRGHVSPPGAVWKWTAQRTQPQGFRCGTSTGTPWSCSSDSSAKSHRFSGSLGRAVS